MSWVPCGKTVSVNRCHYEKVGNFLGGKIMFGGISAGGITAEDIHLFKSTDADYEVVKCKPK